MKRAVWLLTVICVSFTFAACSKQQVRGKPVMPYERGEETEDIVLENAFLELRFLPQTAEIVLKDKVRGTEWYSTPPNVAEDQLANFITREMMRSQFSLQYTDVSGVGETLYSYSQSIERGAYEYAIVDGGIEVNYTVGNVARNFLIPPALPESRMVPLLDAMDLDDRRMIEASYRLYDINNLRSGDNRSTLLGSYPELAQEKVYVMRENTQEFMKEQFEGFFAAAGYTREEYYEDSARYVVSSGVERPAFTVTLRYTLDGNSLIVSVPFNKVAYRTSYPIIRLDILPFMGAGGTEDQGYLLVPDGSGALLYFNNQKYNQNASNNMVYGWDEAMPREVVVSDNKASYPVFGIQKNGNALVCIIEEGASYARVQADVAGRNCSYNSVFAYFDMVHGAVMDISGRSDRAVYLYESGLPQDESITLRYTLCANDGYVGMAKEYRSWLLQKYPELANSAQTAGVPIAVEIVGAVNKTQHRLGIPFDLPLRLTSYKETEKMIHDFAGFGWENVRIKLNGWFNRSVDHTVPLKVKLIGELGSKSDFRNIVSSTELYGYDLFPEVDFVYMKDVRSFDGFSLYRDAARYVNRKRVEKYPFSFVWFGERTRWGKLSYLARPASTMKMIDGFLNKVSSLGLRNIAFRNMGSRLSGDYNEKRAVSRESSLRMRQEKFTQLSGSQIKMLMNTGYAYSVPWADFITDIVLDDQNFGITDVSVPFYSIVLHGLVPYTGRAINLAEDYTINLLKTIEGGAGLYFSFITEETAALQETKFRQFYANEYDKWVGDADTLYRKFSADFKGLYNQAITDHIILAPDITVTVYEDGTRVIVNKSDTDWDYDGNIIRAFNYAVLR